MGGLKQHQLPMAIDEQVENLRRIGLIVENVEVYLFNATFSSNHIRGNGKK